MMDRSFIAGATALLTAPLVGEAQQAGKVPKIGFLKGTLWDQLMGKRALRIPPLERVPRIVRFFAQGAPRCDGTSHGKEEETHDEHCGRSEDSRKRLPHVASESK